MSLLGDAIGRSRRGQGARRPAPVPALPGAAAAPPGIGGETATASADGAPPLGAQRSELEHRRDALAAEVTELHWDLGGLAYEMAIRDHFRLDVLVRRAAVLQERDAELAEVERLLRTEDGEIGGSCPACSAPHSRGAVYCWQCGHALMQLLPSEAAVPQGAPSGVMDALLAPRARPGADGS
jgi:hypothetical protein